MGRVWAMGAAEGTISVRCGCGKKLKAPAGSEGRKARCPDCDAILARHQSRVSIFDLNAATLAYYFFNPMSLIIIAIGMAAAFRTANGSVTG